ncbi:MAG: tyrosine-type recombinase/integrase [Anaerolineae bacterium]
MTLENHSLEHAIEVYLLRTDVEGKSPNTVVAYRETLGMFLEVAREQGFAGDVGYITAEHIYAYLGWVKDRGVSDHTRHRRFREARFLFVWLERIGAIEENPFKHIRNIRLPQKVIQPFSPEEIRRMLEREFSTPVMTARNRAIIMLLLDTGIRLNELVSLRLGDVDAGRQRLRILNGKGKKQRVVGVGDGSLAVLRDYLELRGSEAGPLFVSRFGKAMNGHSVSVMMRRLGKWTGIRKLHPHRFRHTFATWAIESEAREIDVQYLLGHSSPAMVRRYSATYDAEKAARAHAKWSPGDRLAGGEDS